MIEDTQNQAEVSPCPFLTDFTPATSTACFVVLDAVVGLLGATLLKGSVSIYDGCSDNDGPVCLTLFMESTARPLDGIQRSPDLLLCTLQTIVDRILREGRDIELISVSRESFKANRHMMDLMRDAPEEMEFVIALMEEQIYTMCADTRPFYSRTNALGKITLQHIQIGKSTLKIQFGVQDSGLGRLAEVSKKVEDVVEKFNFARIRYQEGHLLYDSLEPWYKWPTTHFTVWCIFLNFLITFYMVGYEVFATDKEKASFLRLESWDDYCGMVIGMVIGFAIGTLIGATVCEYFSRTGVFDRIRVAMTGVKAVLGSETGMIWQLLIVCLVPFLQRVGSQVFSHLATFEIHGISDYARWMAECLVSFVFLGTYPMLSIFAASAIPGIFLHLAMECTRTFRALREADLRRDRKHHSIRLLRLVGILALDVSVYLWFTHLANDVRYSSATFAVRWINIAIVIDFGLPISALLLFVIIGTIILGVLQVLLAFLGGARRLRNQLPRWRHHI